MDREVLDRWCERGILGSVIAILVFTPVAFGGKPQPIAGNFLDVFITNPFVVAQFFTQAGDVHVDRSCVESLGVDPPHARQNFIAADRPPWVRGQVAQQFDLALRQFYTRLIGESHFAARDVDHAAGNFNRCHIGGPLRRAPQHRFHAR